MVSDNTDANVEKLFTRSGWADVQFVGPKDDEVKKGGKQHS